MKIGDMVLLIRIDEESSAYQSGLRVGAIGTVTRVSDFCRWIHPNPYDWVVDFPTLANTHCATDYLRKIDPPEAGRWDYCVYNPEKELERV